MLAATLDAAALAAPPAFPVEDASWHGATRAVEVSAWRGGAAVAACTEVCGHASSHSTGATGKPSITSSSTNPEDIRARRDTQLSIRASSGYRVPGIGYRVPGLGYRVPGTGCRDRTQ